jgi:hypothetical protein
MEASVTPRWLIPSEPERVSANGCGTIEREIWPLPVEEDFLRVFLTDLFEHHWQGIRFGPLIEGAAYEWRCPSAPTKIALFDGYLTVAFSTGGHFHLCIGENTGGPRRPTPPDLRVRRRPSKAQIFRGFGRDGKPLSWGFEMWNGAGEPMISVFFPNPFIEDDDTLSPTPDFGRLATWRVIAATWLRRPAEALDEEGRGFRAGTH